MEDPYPAENIDRLGVLMFQTSDNSQLLRRVLWINAELTIVWSLKHKNTQPSYIFNRENPQKSEPQNGPRRGLDFIACIVMIFINLWLSPICLHFDIFWKDSVTWKITKDCDIGPQIFFSVKATMEKQKLVVGTIGRSTP